MNNSTKNSNQKYLSFEKNHHVTVDDLMRQSVNNHIFAPNLIFLFVDLQSKQFANYTYIYTTLTLCDYKYHKLRFLNSRQNYPKKSGICSTIDIKYYPKNIYTITEQHDVYVSCRMTLTVRSNSIRFNSVLNLIVCVCVSMSLIVVNGNQSDRKTLFKRHNANCIEVSS